MSCHCCFNKLSSESSNGVKCEQLFCTMYEEIIIVCLFITCKVCKELMHGNIYLQLYVYDQILTCLLYHTNIYFNNLIDNTRSKKYKRLIFIGRLSGMIERESWFFDRQNLATDIMCLLHLKRNGNQD